MPNTLSNLDEAIAGVSRQSSVDPEFRTLALKDANAALAKVMGKPAPSDITIRFVEELIDVPATGINLAEKRKAEKRLAVEMPINDGPVKYIVLPESIPQYQELSLEELEVMMGRDHEPDGLKPTIEGAWYLS